MQNNKLYSILSFLDRYEQNRLRKFLSSPYFNKSNTLIKLFEIFIKQINKEKTEELSKETFWKKLHPKQAFDDVRFRKACSDLLRLVEKFLAQQVYEENPIKEATNLIKAVGRKKLTKLYNTTMTAARRTAERQYYRNSKFYLDQYLIENNYYELTDFEMKRASKSNIEDIINNLDHFYLSEKLRTYCTILSRQNIISHDYKVLLIDEIMEHIQAPGFEEIPPIAIYSQIVLTQLENNKQEHYYKLKSLLEKYGKQFPIIEAQFIYTSALNYCIRKINSGQSKFLKEYLDFYDELLETDILIENGYLSPWKFQNTVLIALRLEEYEWTENFIKNYQKLLPEVQRENAVTFNLARLYFYQKKHREVVSLLQTVEYDDFSYNLSSKAMLLVIYYDTEEIEALYSLMESFRTYLNRHKDIPTNRRTNYLNLISFLKLLTKTGPRDKKAIEKLKQELNSKPIAGDRKWLEEKIAELE